LVPPVLCSAKIAHKCYRIITDLLKESYKAFPKKK